MANTEERKEIAIITNDDAPNWRAVITAGAGSSSGKKRYWITLEMFVRIPLQPEGQWVHHWNTFHECDDLFEVTIVSKGAIRRASEKAMSLDDLMTLTNLK